jgi:hypothetical protein
MRTPAGLTVTLVIGVTLLMMTFGLVGASPQIPPWYLTPPWPTNAIPPCGPQTYDVVGENPGSNAGLGFLGWPVSPTVDSTSGNALFDVWAQANATGSRYSAGVVGGGGTPGTLVGFAPTQGGSGYYVGENFVSFVWNITWNYTASLTGAGTVVNDFWIQGYAGYIQIGCTNPIGGNGYQINNVTLNSPGSVSGGTGGMNSTYNVTVTIPGGLTSSAVYFQSEVYSDISSYESSNGQASTELNMGSNGASAWLTSIQVW